MANEVKRVVASRIKTARIFFIISALYGLLLRLNHLIEIPIKYKNILQAHSHVTFLGWGFLAVISIIGLVYYPDKIVKSVYLKRLFQIMTYTLFGMLISFPIQGYKLFSIIFLSIFLITSYLYLFDIYRTLKSIKTTSSKFIRTGIIYYYLSSLAIWTVAIITSKYGKIDMYFNAVYFYLHFLYNGFFVFILFGLLIKYIENNNIKISEKVISEFYWFTNIAVMPAYALSLLWNKMPSYVYIIGFISVLLQILSLYFLFFIIREVLKSINNKHIKNIAIFVLVSYYIKVALQFLSAFPQIIEKALQFKAYFVIGYLHLYTLGFMSMFIILLLKLHPKKKLSELGINTLMIGIFLSEVLMFFQGSLLLFNNYTIPNINLYLFLVSILMPLGLIIIHVKLILKNH